MQSLTLVAVVVALEDRLRDTTLAEIRALPGERFRLAFEAAGRRRPVVVALRPGGAWMGVPPPRRRREKPVSSPFAGVAGRALRGARLAGLQAAGLDRRVRLVFADGHALVAELDDQAPNLVLLDGEESVVAMARSTRATRRRLRVGAAYVPRPLPASRVDPLAASAESIDAAVAEARAGGLDLADALKRRMFGIDAVAARLVVAEAALGERSPGAILRARIAAVATGDLVPSIVAPGDPMELAESGRWDGETCLLRPWAPDESDSGLVLDGSDMTAGLYHDAEDTAARIAGRIRGLRAILERERRRTVEAAARARRDAASFEDPDRYRRWGEALLAGLARARRTGDRALVPDPWSPEGPPLSVPAPPELKLPAVAERHFRSHRRARRGLESARERERSLEQRLERLDAVSARCADLCGLEGMERLLAAMRDAGLPVGLETRPVGRRAPAVAATAPRLEGVRVFTSSDGHTILVGKGGRDNHRLTFKLAGPEDFWLHALGCPGAHVVLRNPERRGEPPAAGLREAAAAAAFYSDARAHGLADVQWTRRKHVRKARNAPPGTVLVKRARTIRVKPSRPDESGESGPT